MGDTPSAIPCLSRAGIAQKWLTEHGYLKDPMPHGPSILGESRVVRRRSRRYGKFFVYVEVTFRSQRPSCEIRELDPLNLGARMTEPDSAMQIRAGSEATRSKGGKGKAVIKRSKADTPSREQTEEVGGRHEPNRQPDQRGSRATPSRDPHLIARIQQQAYVLFKACGCEHGHDLEHWLEAERQITSSSDHSER